MMIGICKSPFNYIGNKHRIVAALELLFPQEINAFVDLFCGGGDVLINTPAKVRYANDINYHLIDIFKEFQRHESLSLLRTIDERIAAWGLNKTDKEAYIRFRDHYNAERDPIDLFILVCFGFNHQLRFNSDHEFNNPFGYQRSCFTATMKMNLMKMLERIKDVKFSSVDFGQFDVAMLGKGDFLYADPPYLLSCGTYNDGKRGFKGWSQADDIRLLKLLSTLNEAGVKFALSNVIRHKGIIHTLLDNWIRDNNFKTYHFSVNYNNCNYQNHNNLFTTDEILVMNY